MAHTDLLDRPDAVTFYLPESPGNTEGTAEIPGRIQWTIRWWNGRESGVMSIKGESLSQRAELRVPLPENGSECVIVHATPVLIDRECTLRSAGGWVYPPADGTTLTLSQGLVAETVLELVDAKVPVASINLERIQSEIDSLYEIGVRKIDRQTFVEGLTGGSFRSYHVRKVDDLLVTVRTLIPPEGVGELSRWGWYTDDQRHPRCEAVEAGDYLMWAISVGEGETRRCWRIDPTDTSISPTDAPKVQRLVVHRYDDDHTEYHIFQE